MNQGPGTGTVRADAYEWVTAPRAPAIPSKLMADDGLLLELSLFDEQDLAEIPILPPAFPRRAGLIACRNPVLAADRARTREGLRAATEKLLAPLIARVRAGRLQGAGQIGVEVGKVISRYKTGKHFAVTITDHSLAVTRKQDQIDAEAILDGFYVLRTPVPAVVRPRRSRRRHRLQEPQICRNGTSGTSNPTTWACRPVFHRLEERVKADVLIRTLACDPTWHLPAARGPR